MLAPSERIAVIGLGYVGLPFAIALSRHFDIVGYDNDDSRVAERDRGHDQTGEVERETIKSSKTIVTAELREMAGSQVLIITVPTPVDQANVPDLRAMPAASQTVGALLEKGALVVLESAVYPGVTKEICGPELATIFRNEILSDRKGG